MLPPDPSKKKKTLPPTRLGVNTIKRRKSNERVLKCSSSVCRLNEEGVGGGGREATGGGGRISRGTRVNIPSPFIL